MWNKNNRGLPSAEQADAALLAVLPSAIFNNSTVTLVTACTKNGDIMPGGSRTTIKGNKTKISDSTGNISVTSAHVAPRGRPDSFGDRPGLVSAFLVYVARRGGAVQKRGRRLDLTDPSADRIPGRGGLTSGYAMSRSTPIASITVAVATWMP
jgi:hypothetical protein